MNLKYDISGAQTDGARDYQEDSFLTSYIQAGENSDQVTLVIVADGMGGHAAGNVASNLAVQSFNQYITTNYPANSISTLLKNALDEANKAIAKTISETAALKGMGCTLVAALFINDQMYSISVGDSHLFHIHNKILTKKNADHSYGGYLDRMAAEGNPVKDNDGYSRHMLLSALTGESIPAIDCPEQPVKLENGDQILLCSDGIDTLDQKTIEAKSLKTNNAKELTKKLLRAVDDLQQPRQDNTTILAVCFASKNGSEVTLSTVKPDQDFLSNKIKSPPNFQKPLTPSIEAKLSKRKTSGSSFFSWLLFLVIITGVGAGAWWYLNENKAVIPEMLREQETITSSPIPPIITKTNDDTSSNKKAETHEIIKFRDQLSKANYSPEMVWVPSGSFIMGGSGSNYPPVNEQPRHEVTIAKFAISSKEITRGEFSKYSGVAVSNVNKDQPVRNVSWETAKKYTRWLSRQSGKSYRLPSESEWEYAARAGTKSPFWWGYKIGVDNALCVGCTSPLEPSRPNSVGSYPSNAFGLHDTAGNVAEWVEDCYHGNYEGAPSDGRVWNNENCKERVVRGGSYFNAAKSLYVSRRDKLSQKDAKIMIGFRIAREE
ncbi:MAG: SUMF1/EgtB/PvdO family nonheme iron enzyme [Gammaproteobacteria bacterium]